MDKQPSLNLNPDILIMGGGLIGSALSLALQSTRYQTLLCDASDLDLKTETTLDTRSIALNQASIQILSQLGVWHELEANASPIQNIQISSQGQFGIARLNAAPDLPLGQVVEIHHFYAALKKKLDPERTFFKTNLIDYDPIQQLATLSYQGKTLHIRPKLVVAADGTTSSLRHLLKLSPVQKDYHQQAIVTNIALNRAHQGMAIERFTTEGPLAILPLQGKRMALVWCVSPAHATSLIEMTPAAFIQALQSAVGYRLGRFTEVGKRMHYPLTQLVMPEPVCQSVVWVGNAAQTLHPVAGQGLNLGLRDVARLAQCLHEEGVSPQALSQYQTQRAPDRQVLIKATNDLIRLFTHSSPPVRLLRSLGLMAFEYTPALQKQIIRYASGFGGISSDLACGMPLSIHNRRSHDL